MEIVYKLGLRSYIFFNKIDALRGKILYKRHTGTQDEFESKLDDMMIDYCYDFSD